jgi:peptidyl-prolyl cis-trans isomerase D
MVRWAYREDVNAVSPVFEFGDNFVVATLKAVREAGVAPLAQVEQDIRAELTQQKKAEVLKEKFNSILANANDINTLASELSQQVQEAPGITFSSFSLPTVGFEPAVIAAGVQSPEGEVVGPIAGNAGVFAITVNAINVEEVDKDAEAMRMLNLYQSRSAREAYEAVKENANIIDKRSKFF